MEFLVASIGFAGAGLLIFYGLKLVIIPAKSWSEVKRRFIRLILPLCMVALSLVMLLSPKSNLETENLSLGEYLGISDLKKVSCRNTWEKIFDGYDPIEGDNSEPLSRLTFSYTDNDGFENQIIFRAGTMTDKNMVQECLQTNNGKSVSMLDINFFNQTEKSIMCDLGFNSAIVLYFRYDLNGVPAIVNILAAKDMIDDFLRETECVIETMTGQKA